MLQCVYFNVIPIFATVYWNRQLLPKLLFVTACFLNQEDRECLLVQAHIIATQIWGKKNVLKYDQFLKKKKETRGLDGSIVEEQQDLKTTRVHLISQKVFVELQEEVFLPTTFSVRGAGRFLRRVCSPVSLNCHLASSEQHTQLEDFSTLVLIKICRMQ